MKKIRHIARDIDPETGDVQHFRAGYTNRELKDQGVLKRHSPTKAQKSRRKKKRKEHYAGCPARPLFTASTPRQDVDDPERLALKAQVLREAGRKCAYCGARWPLTIDHIIPLNRGGGHHRENLQCLCKPCNEAKGERMPYELAA